MDLWNLKSLNSNYRRLIGHKSCVNALATSPGDGIYLASGGDDTNILLWNLWDEETLYSKPAVFNSVFKELKEEEDDNSESNDSDDERESGGQHQNHQDDNQHDNHQISSNPKNPSYAGHKSNIFSIAFTPDGKGIFSSGLDSLIIQHDLERDCIAPINDQAAEKFTKRWSAHDESSIHRICINQSGNVLLSAGSDGMLCGWDLRSNVCNNAIIKLQANQELWSVAFNPIDENLFAAGGDRGYLGLLDMRMVLGEKRSLIGSETIKYQIPVSSTRSESKGIGHLTWNSRGNGRQLLATLQDYLPTLYSIDDPNPLTVFHDQGYRNFCTHKSHCFGGPNDDWIIAGSDDYKIYVWNRRAREDDNNSSRSSYCQRLDPKSNYNPSSVKVMDKASAILDCNLSNPNTTLWHPTLPLLFASGVEKAISVYSTVSTAMESLPSGFQGHHWERRESLKKRLLAHPALVNVFRMGLLNRNEDTDPLKEDFMTLAYFDILNQEDSKFL